MLEMTGSETARLVVLDDLNQRVCGAIEPVRGYGLPLVQMGPSAAMSFYNKRVRVEIYGRRHQSVDVPTPREPIEGQLVRHFDTSVEGQPLPQVVHLEWLAGPLKDEKAWKLGTINARESQFLG